MRFLKFPFVILAFVVLIAVVAVSAQFDAPWAKEQIEKLVRENCEGCEFNIGGAAIAWRGLVLSEVTFANGEKGAKHLHFKVVRVVIRPEILPLFKRQVHIDSVTAFAPVVTYSEGDRPENNPSRPDEKKAGHFELNRVAVYEGKFVYVRDHKGTHAVLTINDIAGKIEFASGRAQAKFNAQMGRSGNFDLYVSTALKKPLDIDAELFVREQNLEDLSVFFKPNAGVELAGILVKAHSVSKVRGDNLNSRVTIAFKDLKVHVDEMYDRSEIQAFFTNIGASIALKKENLDESKEDMTEFVDTKRKGGESVMHFILMGLKEAALKTAR